MLVICRRVYEARRRRVRVVCAALQSGEGSYAMLKYDLSRYAIESHGEGRSDWAIDGGLKPRWQCISSTRTSSHIETGDERSAHTCGRPGVSFLISKRAHECGQQKSCWYWAQPPLMVVLLRPCQWHPAAPPRRPPRHRPHGRSTVDAPHHARASQCPPEVPICGIIPSQ